MDPGGVTVWGFIIYFMLGFYVYWDTCSVYILINVFYVIIMWLVMCNYLSFIEMEEVYRNTDIF